MNIAEAINKLDEHITEKKEFKNALMAIGEIPDDIAYEIYTTLPIIEVKTFQDMNKLRKYLSRKIGWRDKLGSIWYSSTMMAEYQGLKHNFKLWLSTNPEEFPKELQSDNCKIVKETIVEKKHDVYRYVCGVQNGTDA
jgi:hypothetical protein